MAACLVVLGLGFGRCLPRLESVLGVGHHCVQKRAFVEFVGLEYRRGRDVVMAMRTSSTYFEALLRNLKKCGGDRLRLESLPS